MNHTERLAFTERIFEQCLDIMRTKGLSYASEGDASENFKRIAEASGMTKYQVWAVYFGKHVLSLNNAVKRNPDFPAVADGEPIAGRVADIINYAVLLAMMVQDDSKINVTHNIDGSVTFPIKRIETDPQVYRDGLKNVPISDVERTRMVQFHPFDAMENCSSCQSVPCVRMDRDYVTIDGGDEYPVILWSVGCSNVECKRHTKDYEDIDKALDEWEQMHNCVPFDPASEEKKK